MKAVVDEASCSGCGVCIDVSPDTFEMGDNDVVMVTADPIPAEFEDAVRDAAEQCPSESIIIE
jgi:ferredoxin